MPLFAPSSPTHRLPWPKNDGKKSPLTPTLTPLYRKITPPNAYFTRDFAQKRPYRVVEHTFRPFFTLFSPCLHPLDTPPHLVLDYGSHIFPTPNLSWGAYRGDELVSSPLFAPTPSCGTPPEPKFDGKKSPLSHTSTPLYSKIYPPDANFTRDFTQKLAKTRI